MRTRNATFGLGWALGLSLALSSLPTAAQDNPQAKFGEEVAVTEVLLDALVTDRQGNVIIGLHPDDFIVEEDGKPIQVDDVSFYSNRRLLDSTESLGQAGAAIDTAPKSRYFILFFQEQQGVEASNPGVGLLKRQLEAAREARKWVSKERLLDDYVAVLSYDVKLKVHQDFTQDGAQILRGIDSAVTGKDPGENWPSRLPEVDTEQGVVSLRAGLPKGAELGKQSRTIYEALQIVAEAAGGIVGRKNLVYFGIGFGEQGSFGLYKPDPRYYPGMVRQLNDHNVAVYALDLVPSEVDYDLSNALHQLTNETGGTYYNNFVSFQTPLKQIASENSGYYLLSYRSPRPAGTTGYQKVSVRTKNKEFRVRTREGYLFGG